MWEILQLVKRKYSITATSVKPFHSVWKLTTATGEAYILKKLKTNPDRFSELARIINQYHAMDFKALIPFLPTCDGEFYINSVNDFYSLSPWCAGEKPSFRNQCHLKLIAQCFGKFHANSKTIIFPQALINQQGLTEYQTCQDFLELLLPKLPERDGINRIDRAIIDWSNYYLQQGRFALLKLADLKNYQPLFSNQKGLCHNDPAPGNIMIGNKQCYLIDFEFSNCDLFIKELALLAQRALQAAGWQGPILDILITTYDQERPLLSVELEILPYLICFPRRFWRFCYQRYQEQLPWTEKRYQRRLWEIINEEPKRRRFLQTWWPELNILNEN